MASKSETEVHVGTNVIDAASDEELLVRYRSQGDIEAFDALVHRYERPVYNYLLRYLHDAQLAEEVFQATFLRLHSRAHLYTEGRPVRPWLYRIATTCAIDALRKEGRHQAVSLDQARDDAVDNASGLVGILTSRTADPSVQLDQKERRDWTRKAVAKFTPRLESTCT